eukprot:65486_1
MSDDNSTPRLFTLKEIHQCDGVNSDKIYMCIDGLVFDCTRGNVVDPMFAGHDITYVVAMNTWKKEDVDKFGVVWDEGQLKPLIGWKKYFSGKYKLVGKLTFNDDNDVDSNTTMKTLTLEELHKYNGVNKGELIYVCVDGHVFDVTKGKTNYGVGGGYSLFAGNDVTYSLAINSLDKKNLNVFEFQLNEKQQKALQKWKQFYETTYTVVGKLNKMYRKKGNIQSNL